MVIFAIGVFGLGAILNIGIEGSNHKKMTSSDIIT